MSARLRIYEHLCDQFHEAQDEEDEEAASIWDYMARDLWSDLTTEEQKTIRDRNAEFDTFLREQRALADAAIAKEEGA